MNPHELEQERRAADRREQERRKAERRIDLDGAFNDGYELSGQTPFRIFLQWLVMFLVGLAMLMGFYQMAVTIWGGLYSLVHR